MIELVSFLEKADVYKRCFYLLHYVNLLQLLTSGILNYTFMFNSFHYLLYYCIFEESF